MGIKAGDEVEILRYGNQFNIIKKVSGSAKGILKGTKVKNGYSDVESLQSNFE